MNTGGGVKLKQVKVVDFHTGQNDPPLPPKNNNNQQQPTTKMKETKNNTKQIKTPFLCF